MKDGKEKLTMILTKKQRKVKEKSVAPINSEILLQSEYLRYITEKSKKFDYRMIFN